MLCNDFIRNWSVQGPILFRIHHNKTKFGLAVLEVWLKEHNPEYFEDSD